MTNHLAKHAQRSGRKVAEIDLRRIEIKTLVNENEYEAITNNAARAGMARGAYLRALGLEYEIVAPMPPICRATLVELGRIGNNLNQVSKRLNAGQLSDLEEVLNLISELKARLFNG